MKIFQADIIKFDRSIQYSKDVFSQKAKYINIEEDVIGPLYIKNFLKDLGNQILIEKGINSPEFENFEIFEDLIRSSISGINSLKELERMRKAFNL